MSKKTAAQGLSDAFDSMAEKALKVKRDRDALLAALQALLDACPTGWGDDRRLNDAQKAAEKAIKEATNAG